MARELAKSTVERFRKRLETERDNLEAQIAEYEREIEEARMTEASSDRSPDPGNAEASSAKLEYAKELSIEQNTVDLLGKVRHALLRIEAGAYGICESCESEIAPARLEAMPFSRLCVSCQAEREKEAKQLRRFDDERAYRRLATADVDEENS